MIHTDHVEAPLAGKWQVTKVLTSDQHKGAPLGMVHGRFCGFDVVAAAGLDLDKTEDIFVPADKVDFTVVVRRAKVPRHHDIAEPA
ncbi:MAG TPA: hypothetical protein VLW84_06370 [Terriglobales bacterium]|nr:hypothetical protein [Terriglobales bacterium]